jgi:hypothetical protein
MKNLFAIISFVSALGSASFAFGEVQLSLGESISIGGQEVACGGHPSIPIKSCFCADSGCSTGFTSAGNVILNIQTTDSSGSTRTQCVEYKTESQCLQAMSACN